MDEGIARKIYQEYKDRLKKYIFRRVDNDSEAEEILQQTLTAAVDSLPLFSGRSSFFTWLCGIANHKITDYYRKKKIKTILFSSFPFLETIASDALGPDEKLEREELKKEVKTVLTALAEGYREILRLKYLEGFSMAEIARTARTSIKAVESKLTRAREAFKKEWALNKLKD